MSEEDRRPDQGTAPAVYLSDLAARIAILEGRGNGRTDFQTWTAVATLFAIAIYGAARFGDTAFYARLGTDPDAVGLTYGVTLARVGTTIAVSAAGVLTLFLFGRHLARPSGERRGQGPWSKLCLVAVVGLAFVISVILLILIIPPAAVPVTLVRNLIALACAVALIYAGYKYEQTRRRPGAFDPIRSFIAAAMTIAVLFGIAALTGYHSAGYIMRDESLPCPCVSFMGHNITLPWSSGTNGFLGIQAESADVIWIGPGRSVIPESAILLGESDSSVILFDTGMHSVLVIPADDVMVRPLSNLTGWNER